MSKLNSCAREKMGWTTLVFAFGVIAVIASGQSTQLTAREIFYAPATAAVKPGSVKTEPVKPAQPGTKAGARKTESPAEVKTGAKTVVVAEDKGTVTPGGSTSNAGDAMKPVALTHKALGIRLSILRSAAGGQATEVAPETNFRPGDRVRLSIQVSDNGHLYIIDRGSSGTWTQLFPSPELPNASNIVAPGVTYSVPPDRNFVIGDPPGEEKLFIILSRKPELDLHSLMTDMSQRERQNSSPKEEPGQPVSTTLEATIAPMSDAMVERIRSVYARDLIIEEVDQQTPGARKENAVYAVNPGNGNDTRVVLDAGIKHK